jgi:hypothetical protein
VRVSLDRVEPVLDAPLDGVRGGRADTGLDLGVELVEVVFDFRLAAYRAADPLAVRIEAERNRANVALVDLAPRDAIVAVAPVVLLQFRQLGPLAIGISSFFRL